MQNGTGVRAETPRSNSVPSGKIRRTASAIRLYRWLSNRKTQFQTYMAARGAGVSTNCVGYHIAFCVRQHYVVDLTPGMAKYKRYAVLEDAFEGPEWDWITSMPTKKARSSDPVTREHAGPGQTEIEIPTPTTHVFDQPAASIEQRLKAIEFLVGEIRKALR